jgi:glycosyltransferase involved in cell wall biosynthesis
MNNGRPRITLCFPALNEEKYVHHVLDSLARQTRPADEVIVVAAGTDHTAEICAQAGARVIRQISKGVSGARLEGFAAATGDYIASTDADTRLTPNWLERVEADLEPADVVACYGPVQLLDGRVIHHRIDRAGMHLFMRLNHAIGKPHLAGMNFACRRDAYEAIGGFRPELVTAEDVDLGLRLREVGRVVWDPHMLVYTSARRLRGMGTLGFFRHHATNYVRMYATGQSSDNFEPYR